jgi:hypothetical protein
MSRPIRERWQRTGYGNVSNTSGASPGQRTLAHRMYCPKSPAHGDRAARRSAGFSMEPSSQARDHRAGKFDSSLLVNVVIGELLQLLQMALPAL